MRRWSCSATALVLLAGCMRPPAPKLEQTPVTFQDISPRWSKSGDRLALLRVFSNKTASVIIVSPDLKTRLLETTPFPFGGDRTVDALRDRYFSRERIAWSPDGNALAVQKSVEIELPDRSVIHGSEVWQLDTRTGGFTPLAVRHKTSKSIYYFLRSPGWSADGRYFSWIGEGLHGDTALFIRPANRLDSGETEVQPLFDPHAETDWPVWSPTGSTLAFRRDITPSRSSDTVEALMLRTPGSNEAKRLLTISPRELGKIGKLRASPRIAHVAWSPDGKRIAFTVFANPSDARTANVWITDPATGSLREAHGAGLGVGMTLVGWLNDSQILAASHAGADLQFYSLKPGTDIFQPVARLNTSDFDLHAGNRTIAACVLGQQSDRSTLAVQRFVFP